MLPDPLDMFLDAVDAYAERPAVIQDERTTTYSEIGERAARIAGAIAQAGHDHPRVLIHLPQSMDAYAAMYATLMAGGFYCPLNLEHPLARRQSVVSLFDPDIVITGAASSMDGLSFPEQTRVVACHQLSSQEPLSCPRPAHHLAYVIFTSGSTGEPKGVMIGREGLGHYTAWAHEAMQVTPEDRWSQHPNIAFDLSVLDIYGSLCAGAALVPITGRKARLLPAMTVRDQRLTIWNSVPSVIDQMRQGKQLKADNLSNLKLMTFCGEPLLRDHLEAIFEVLPDITVHNTYGPTEATVSCTLVRIDRDNYRDYSRHNVALGAAIDGMQIDLVGGSGNNEGEIVISGPQVSYGYWRQPEQTRAVFSASDGDPPSRRSYRTGDWAEMEDGELYFVARVDRQAKRAGYRIELGDIDAAVRSACNSGAATVLVEGHLCVFVEQTGDKTDLMDRLHKILPPYSLPDEIRYIDCLPRNANDKIDFGALETMIRSGN